MISTLESIDKSWINQRRIEYPWRMAKSVKEPRRGGHRKGAGRKPLFESRARVSFDLERADLDALASIAESKEVSLSQLLREAVKSMLRRKRS
jgi:hypothetical protein